MMLVLVPKVGNCAPGLLLNFVGRGEQAMNSLNSPLRRGYTPQAIEHHRQLVNGSSLAKFL
eukprot:scaffold24923_cov22-Tisochrysis_lutea.AAC.1